MPLERIVSIPGSPFFIFPFPDSVVVTMREIVAALGSRGRRPLVIYLARRTIQPPWNYDSQLDQCVISIPKGRIPDGLEFSEFKRMVGNYRRHCPDGPIGVSSSKGKDLCCYMVVRWLIEEMNFTGPSAMSAIRHLVGDSVKMPYRNSIGEIYQEELEFVTDSEAAIVPSSESPISESRMSSPDFQDEPHLQISSPLLGSDDFEIMDIPLMEGQILCKDSREIPVVPCCDPVLEMIGSPLTPKDAIYCRSLVRTMLEVPPFSPILKPYVEFDHSSLNMLKERDCFISPEPIGLRCILLLFGSRRILMDDFDFAREINLYLPRRKDKPSVCNDGIFQCILSRRPDNAPESRGCVLYIIDVFRMETIIPISVPYDARLRIVSDKIIGKRQVQWNNPSFRNNFETDDVKILVRRKAWFYHMANAIRNPSGWIERPKCSGICLFPAIQTENDRVHFWHGPFRRDLVVQVRVGSGGGGVEGVVQGVDEMIVVMRFSGDVKVWKEVYGQCVAVRRLEEGWRVVGKWCEENGPMSEIEFRNAVVGEEFGVEALESFILGIKELREKDK
jgi:hypothetical protein